MTMAATGIGRPTSVWPSGVLANQLTPVHANDIAKNNQCYTSGGLNPFKLAPLLGMKIQRFVPNAPKKWEQPLPADPVAHVDGHIGSGGVVAAHIDYKDKHSDDFTRGDHWVLITNKASDGGFRDYDALDPSGGHTMGMSKNLAVTALPLMDESRGLPEVCDFPTSHTTRHWGLSVILGLVPPSSTKSAEIRLN